MGLCATAACAAKTKIRYCYADWRGFAKLARTPQQAMALNLGRGIASRTQGLLRNKEHAANDQGCSYAEKES